MEYRPQMLQDLLNWDGIRTARKSTGGHTEVMDVLFKESRILASFVENDYQGKLGYVYLVYDFQRFAKIVVISDYFGSCGGCDAWEDPSDDDVKHMCIQLANNAHTFNSVQEAIDFLRTIQTMEETSTDGEYYDLRGLAGPLADQLVKIDKL